MRTAHRVLAIIICALIAVQSAVMVWAIAGLEQFLGNGGTIDPKSEDLPNFPEAVGLMMHGMNGMMVIPLITIALFVISFFTKVPGAVAKSGAVLALVALQVALGLFGHSVALVGLLHGLNALLLFAAAFVATRVTSPERAVEPVEAIPAMV